MSAAAALYRFRGLAVIGASPRNAYAFPIFTALRKAGYAGRVACINPNGEDVAGHPGFASLAGVPFDLDAAVVIVRADRVAGVVDDCGRHGIRGVTIISSGFAESGPDGRALQAEVAAVAARYGIAVCGPNGLGFFSLHDRTSTFCAPGIPSEAGDVAVVAQSGGMLNEVIAYGTYRGLRFSKAVSSGNEAVLATADYIEELLDDGVTSTIGLIVEGVRAADRLEAALARAHRQRTPVIALAIGSSPLGAAAAATHTGASPESFARFAALAQSCGVVLVDDLDELCEALLAFSYAQRQLRAGALPRGCGIVEISGGGKGLICDLAAAAGVALPALSAAGAERVAAALGPAGPVPGNPIDLGISWHMPSALALHETALEVLLAEGTMDTIVSRLTVPPDGDAAGIIAQGRLLVRVRDEHPDVLVAALGRTSDAIHPDWRAFCAEHRLLYLQSYRRGLVTLGRLARYRSGLPPSPVTGRNTPAAGSQRVTTSDDDVTPC
jgi:acyl-CoA synthetase (NDP forming)